MRPSLTTKQGKAKCLHCRKKVAKVLFNISITSRVRCEKCALLVNNPSEKVNKKGFLVREIGYHWISREYIPID
jgi:DNA-directed RNA polymerase subunit RPC12/RpoP